ncbi:MAG: hypothetical protein GY757_04210 [bacterium]|nr:hypothetical protein [bacterium]
MKKKLFLCLILLFALSFYSFADSADKEKEAQTVLKPGDVKQFIKSFPLMKKDFERLGAKYDAKAGNVTVPQALKASSDFMGILKKHGWDEHFFNKMMTIVMGYTSIQYGKGLKKAGAGFEKGIKEIKDNPHLSKAMKEQLIKQMKAATGVMKTQGSQFSRNIHKKDMELISPLVIELKRVLE